MSSELCPEMVGIYRERFADWMNQLTHYIRRAPALGPIYLNWDPRKSRALDEVDTFCQFAPDARCSVLLVGAKGTGKTTTAVHAAIEYAKQHVWLDLLQTGDLPDPDAWLVAWSVPDFFRLTSCIYGDDGRQSRAAIEYTRKAKLVILDDVGQEGGNQDAVAAFYDVVNTRYSHQRPTLITTNVLPHEWETYRGGSLVRCADRWHEMCTWIALTGESMRQT
jgi:DNA replication protein DnaC